MIDILAVRDNDTQQTVELRELTADEDANFAAFAEATRRKYPAPQYDVTYGAGESLEDFLKGYPRYRRGESDGASDTPEPAAHPRRAGTDRDRED